MRYVSQQLCLVPLVPTATAHSLSGAPAQKKKQKKQTKKPGNGLIPTSRILLAQPPRYFSVDMKWHAAISV
jgi:hypothetical protein